MKLFLTLIGMVLLFMVSFWLMASGFRGIVTSPSSLGTNILSFLAGVICLIAGLIAGVYLLKPEYRT